VFNLRHSSRGRNYQLKWLLMKFIIRSKRLLLLLLLLLLLSWFLYCLLFYQMLCPALNLFTWLCLLRLILLLLFFFFPFIVADFRENLPYSIARFLFFTYSNRRFRDNRQSIAWTIQLRYLVYCLRHSSQIANQLAISNKETEKGRYFCKANYVLNLCDFLFFFFSLSILFVVRILRHIN